MQLNKLNNITTRYLLGWWLSIGIGTEIAYGENTLKDISFTALPGNKIQLILTLATTATSPNTFTVDSPPRLVLDFPDTKLALPSRTIMIGIGAVRSVTSVEAENRTRVVFNFDRKVTYDIKLRANTVLLNMDNGLNVATQKTRIQVAKIDSTPAASSKPKQPIKIPDTVPITSPIDTNDKEIPSVATKEPKQSEEPPVISQIKKPASKRRSRKNKSEEPKPIPLMPTVIPPAVSEPESPINVEEPIAQVAPVAPIEIPEIPAETSLTSSNLQAIDFRRGPNGEGQILITLNHPSTAINLTEKGKNVIVEALNTSLPKTLHQKLDVIDFATPVQTITSEPKGNDVHISVNATGDYEYVAYQVDKLYTLEFYPLTPDVVEKKKKERKTYTGERLTLNFQDIPVRSLLNLIGDFADRNVVISDNVKGNVTLRLKNVPWDQALDIILKTKFLGKREHDTVIYIAPSADLVSQEQAELEANQKIEELAPLKIELIQLNYAKAEEIRDVLKNAGASSTTKDVSSISPVTDRKTSKIEKISSGDSNLLSIRGNVTVYKQTNSLLIQDTVDKLEQVRDIIAKLDVPQKQVLIESRIVIADNDFSKELGVRFGWSGARELGGGNEVNIGGGLAGHIEGSDTMNHGTWLADIQGNPFGAGFAGVGDGENLMVNLPASSATGAVDFLIGKIGSYLLQLELSAMQSEGRGEVVSSPRVVASDNTEALIEQGVELPYSVVSSDGTNTEFKSIKLSLNVIPHITEDNRINLELDVKKETPVIFGNDIGANTRYVKTTLLVNNGETVSLGGIYEQTKTTSKKSVPVFEEIPVFGELFKNTSSQDGQRELLIFVTPRILNSDAIKISK